MVKQIWIKARCNGNKLASTYLKYLNIKIDENPRETLKRSIGIELNDPMLIIIPAFNDLIGGASLNRLKKRLMGPVLNSGTINVADAEVHLIDGTYLGTAKQLRTYLKNVDQRREG